MMHFMYRRMQHIWYAATALLLLVPHTASAQKLENPLEFDTVREFVQRVIEVVIMIALPVIVFFVIFAGFQFVTAQGNQSKLQSARKNLLWVLVGAALLLGAWALAELIGGTLDQIRGGA